MPLIKDFLDGGCFSSEGLALANIEEVLSLKALPDASGIYIFKSGDEQVLYVGKAINIRKRVQSYFKGPVSLKTSSMLKKAVSIEFVITQTEKEALLLESQYIKKYRPPYNVILRDDKNYPVLRIDPRESFPKLEIVRRFKNDGALYFGPYPSAQSLRELVKFLRRTFPLRKCPYRNFIRRERPCLNYNMGLCLAPCSGKIPTKLYRSVVSDLISFLETGGDDLRLKLQDEMKKASENLEFEKAASYRDRLIALDRLREKQSVICGISSKSKDVFGYYAEENGFFLTIVFARQGIITGQKGFNFKDASGEASEIIVSFVNQYYALHPFIPDEIVIPIEITEKFVLEEMLSNARGKRVKVVCSPWNGSDRDLLVMAMNNAREYAKVLSSEISLIVEKTNLVQTVFNLPSPPALIACVDISNMMGKHTVGAVVVFKRGRPDHTLYRSYILDGEDKPNDPLNIRLTLEKLSHENPELFAALDLLLIDGGKGQLHEAQKVVESHSVKPFLVAIAKDRSGDLKPERIQGEKLYVAKGDKISEMEIHPEAMKFIQRIRDESHRFALSRYQKEHRRTLNTSVLDRIKGVGPRRKKILLKHFESIESIKKAPLEDLLAIAGIPPEVAHNIYEFFHPR